MTRDFGTHRIVAQREHVLMHRLAKAFAACIHAQLLCVDVSIGPNFRHLAPLVNQHGRSEEFLRICDRYQNQIKIHADKEKDRDC